MSPDYEAMLEVAIGEARRGLAEGGIPIGAALFDGDGQVVRLRPQPARAGRRPVGSRRDGCVPQGRAGNATIATRSW